MGRSALAEGDSGGDATRRRAPDPGELATTHTPPVRRLEDGWPAFAAVGVALSLMLTAFGTFTGPGSDEPGTELSEWLVVVAITLVAAVVVFGLVAKVVAGQRGNLCAGLRAAGAGQRGRLLGGSAGGPGVRRPGLRRGRALRPGAAVEPSMAAAGLAAVTVGAAIWLAVYG